jgi:hypothetical protein
MSCKRQKTDHKEFNIINKIIDKNIDYSNEVINNFIYSQYIYNESLESFIKNIKITISKLNYTAYIHFTNNIIRIISFNSPSFYYGKIKIFLSDSKDVNKYTIQYEYIDGCKSYMYKIYRWIHINLISNNLNTILIHNPQINENIYQINDQYIIILFDRLLSNNDSFVKSAIYDIANLIYNKSNHIKLIENNIIEILLQFIFDKYTNFNINWINIMNCTIIVYHLLCINNMMNLLEKNVELFPETIVMENGEENEKYLNIKDNIKNKLRIIISNNSNILLLKMFIDLCKNIYNKLQ